MYILYLFINKYNMNSGNMNSDMINTVITFLFLIMVFLLSSMVLITLNNRFSIHTITYVSILITMYVNYNYNIVSMYKN